MIKDFLQCSALPVFVTGPTTASRAEQPLYASDAPLLRFAKAVIARNGSAQQSMELAKDQFQTMSANAAVVLATAATTPAL